MNTENKLHWNGHRFVGALGRQYEASFIGMLDMLKFESSETLEGCSEFDSLVELFASVPVPIDESKFPDCFLPHQVRAARWLADMGMRGLLAYDMGTGKTLIAITTAIATGRLPALVICPPHLKVMWESELEKWGGGSSHVMEGQKSVVKKADWTMINRDILSHNLDSLLSLPLKLIVIDEAHLLGGNGTKANQAAKTLCKHVRESGGTVIAMTGTPVVNSPGDVHTVLGYVDTRICGTRQPFMVRFDPDGELRRTIAFRVHRGNMPRWMAAKLYRELKEKKGKSSGDLQTLKEVLDVWSLKQKYIPEKETTRNTTIIRLPMRDILGDKFMDDFDRKMSFADAGNAIAEKELPSLLREMAEAKAELVINWVEDRLEEIDGKIVLMGWHVKPKELFAERLGDRAVLIEGTPKKRKKAMDAFQTDSNVRVAICNVQTSGTGLTLTAASEMVFAEVPWNTAAFVQAQRRIDRIGQEATELRYTLFLAAGSAEIKKYAVMKTKGKLADILLEDNDETDNEGE